MNKNVIKKDFIDMIQAKTPVDGKGLHWSKADCETALGAVIDVLTDIMVAGDKVTIQGFGTFTVNERKGREGVNPKTQEKIVIPDTVVPKFKASKNLKDMVAGK